MPAAAPVTAPAADRVYTHVKQGVLDRRYEGGTLLTEGELADAVGVSRTPVREALLKLEVEGLIKLYPKKGALVLAVSAQEIADVVETRLLVEEFAARKAVPASAALIARLGRAARTAEAAGRGRRPGRRRRHRPVPSTPRSCATAATRSSPGSTTSSRDRQLRMGVAVMDAHPDRIAKNVTEHGEMLEALRAGDADAAAELVRRHVEPGQGTGPG